MARLAGAMRLAPGSSTPGVAQAHPPIQLRLSEAVLATLLAAPKKGSLRFDPGNGTPDAPPVRGTLRAADAMS